MTQAKFEQICNEVVRKLRELAPRRTGNLADNSIRFEFVNNECHIYVDEDIAPYMPYTNEKWISPKWNGKQNPNEEWWQDAIELHILRELVAQTGGELQ